MALVREDMPAHAIWTVAVVSHSLVVHHNHHHSWELERVEARVTVIADVTAHAMDPKLLLSLSLSLHQQVVELEAILVEIQADMADLAVQQNVHEDSVEKEDQDHQRK